jgi:hypothetical protein
MLTSTLPAPPLIGRLIAGLVGRECTSERQPAAAVDLNQPSTVAVYVRDNGMLAAVIVSDLALTAGAGAALALIPPPAAADAVESNSLPDSLAENYQEIVNVAARMFNRPNLPHVRLKEMHITPAMLPGDVSNLISTAPERLYVETKLEGYPDGRMWLFA